MKIVSRHVAAGQKHGQRQSPSDTVTAVRHQPNRGRIHMQDCWRSAQSLASGSKTTSKTRQILFLGAPA